MPKHVPAVIAVIVVLLLAAAACGHGGPLNGRAGDEWTRHYSLSPTGQISISNTNGNIDVDPADGPQADDLEVRAERIAHAVTDQGARDLLPRIVIKEDIHPDAVSIETEKLAGIMIGASFEVRYHVKAPRNAAIHVSTTNGRITMTGLGGAVEAETTNGPINIDLAGLGAGKVRVQTTNGPLTLTVPDGTKADVRASVTNGGISVMAAGFDASDQSRRHVEGKLNGGGTSIDLSTTNGPIRFATRSPER